MQIKFSKLRQILDSRATTRSDKAEWVAVLVGLNIPKCCSRRGVFIKYPISYFKEGALGKEKGDEIIAKNAGKRKDSVLWKRDKILAKNAEKRKDSVLWKTDKIVAKNAEKRKDSVLWKTDKIVARCSF